MEKAEPLHADVHSREVARATARALQGKPSEPDPPGDGQCSWRSKFYIRGDEEHGETARCAAGRAAGDHMTVVTAVECKTESCRGSARLPPLAVPCPTLPSLALPSSHARSACLSIGLLACLLSCVLACVLACLSVCSPGGLPAHLPDYPLAACPANPFS